VAHVVTGASIYSLADGAHAKVESAAWARFAAPGSTTEFCASWLAILCGQLDRVNGAMVLLQSGEPGSFSPAATWPDAAQNLLHLGPTAEATLKDRRGVVQSGLSGAAAATFVGYPIEVDGQLHGAIVLDLRPRPDPDVQRVLRQIHWGSAWLLDQFRQQAQRAERERIGRLAVANEILATALQEGSLGACMLAVANELAARLSCERVAVGLARADTCEVKAMSHTATFDPRSDFVRQLGDAMDEVLDFDQPQVHPPLDADAIGGLAHAALSAARGDAAIVSVPLADDRDRVGVLTLERPRERPFDAGERDLCLTIGLLLGPVLALKQRDELPAWRRAQDGARAAAVVLFGPRHPGTKLIALVAMLAVVLLSVVDTTYRVTSKVVIEGAVQRAVVAPFQGFVAEGLARAGDAVKPGQVLARLDDRDLRLERNRWAAEAEQMQRRYRQAAAAQDRAQMTVAAAQEDQAQAQLALVEERLARATLRAPFDGVVVIGDLSQLLGSPVEQGKVLFEVAPLDAYRVVLNVDERDVGELVPGQPGELALAGMPYERLRFTVRQVTPISTPQEGRNFFRVEARLDAASVRLRPGMEGVGKVEVGNRKLIWIWTHPLLEWLELGAWRWLG
jgi:RND family efflux transporter MFP subunit